MSEMNNNNKPRWIRHSVGSVRKSTEMDKPSYVFLNRDSFDALVRKFASLSPEDKGVYVNLESKEFKRQSLEKRIADGIINNQETIDKARAAVEAHPDWVLFDMTLLEKAS